MPYARHAVGYRNRSQAFAIPECVTTNGSHAIWYNEFGDLSTFTVNKLDRFAYAGIYTSQNLVSAERRIIIYRNFHDVNTTAPPKGIVSYARHAVGNRDGGQAAILECTGTDARYAVGNRDGGQACPKESIVSDARHAIRNRD